MKRFFLFLVPCAFALTSFAASTPPPLPATAKLDDAGGIAARVVRSRIAGVDVIAYPSGVKDVVTFRGSLPAGDAFAADDNAAIPTLVGMMLDKGTTRADKFAIAEQLERVGATIRFDVGTQMAEVSAKCLKKDAPLVLSLIAEQLRTPAFSA
jgi:zinc protease